MLNKFKIRKVGIYLLLAFFCYLAIFTIYARYYPRSEIELLLTSEDGLPVTHPIFSGYNEICLVGRGSGGPIVKSKPKCDFDVGNTVIGFTADSQCEKINLGKIFSIESINDEYVADCVVLSSGVHFKVGKGMFSSIIKIDSNLAK